MAKNIKILIMSICVVLLCVGGYFLVDKLVSTEKPSENNKVSLVYCQYANANNIRITLKNGDTYLMSTNYDNFMKDKTQGMWILSFYNEYAGLEYNNSTVNDIFYAVYSLTATRTLEVKKEDLVNYGLDVPQSTVVLTKNNGDRITLYIGNAVMGSTDYYCMMENDDRVYVISNGAGEKLIQGSNQLRVKRIDLYSWEDMNSMTWQYNGGDVVTIEKNPSDDIYNPFSYDIVTSPWQKPAIGSTTDFSTTLSNSFTIITIVDFVTKNNTEGIDLAEYGLDAPWGYFKMMPKEGDTLEFSFGNYVDDAKENCYMRDIATGQIYIVKRSPIETVISTNAFDVTSRVQVSISYENVSTLEYELANGEKHVLKHVRRFYSDAEKENLGTDKEFESTFSFDGITQSSDYASQMYLVTAYTTIAGTYKDVYSNYDKTPILKFTYNPFDTDEKPRTFAFYSIPGNDNFCVISIDGNIDFIADKNNVERVLAGIESLRNGKRPEI